MDSVETSECRILIELCKFGDRERDVRTGVNRDIIETADELLVKGRIQSFVILSSL
jgi:hypothetical protein